MHLKRAWGDDPEPGGHRKKTGVVSRRKRYGDWEVDLIQGGVGSGFLLPVDERKSRIGKLHRLPDKSSAETMKAIVTVLHGFKVSSITHDRAIGYRPSLWMRHPQDRYGG